jgi:hypothetical protein
LIASHMTAFMLGLEAKGSATISQDSEKVNCHYEYCSTALNHHDILLI